MSISQSQIGFLSVMAAVPVALLCTTAPSSMAAEIKIKINTGGGELKQLASSGGADPCFIHSG